MKKKLIMGLATVGLAFALTITGIVVNNQIQSKACTNNIWLNNECKIVMEQDTYYLEGERVAPKFKVIHGTEELINGVDYYVELSRNESAGTGEIKIQGQGNYVGNLYKKFTIKDLNAKKKQKISFPDACVATLVGTDFYYDGVNPVCPDVVVKYGNEKLVANKDYTIRYVYNEAYNWAYAEMWGMGRFEGRMDVDYRIKKPNPGSAHKIYINTCEVELENNCYTFNGISVKPKVIVTDLGANKQLVEGVDYTVSYSKNTKVGTGKVTVKGMGEYKGKETLKFAIK